MNLDWWAEHWLAGALLLAYSGLLLHHANLGRRQAQGMSGYYVGGRRSGGFVIGVSFFATYASTNSYVGNAGKGYAYGLPWLICAAVMVLFTWLSWTAVAPRLRRFAAHWDAMTLPDLLHARFAPETNALRLVSALVVICCSLLYLVAIFKGAGALFQHFLGISYGGAVGVTLVVVMLYTSVGGFVSVVRTDVAQGCLMVLGASLMFYFVTSAAGGVGALPQLQERADTAFLFEWNGGVPLVVLLGIALSGALKLLVDPRQLSRFYALRDDRALKVGLWVSVLGIALVQFCLYPIGLYAHFLVQGVTDTDSIVPMLVNDRSVFPLAVADFLMVAILAAAMSSMDSVLLVAASVLYKDVVAVLRRQSAPMPWTRFGVVGFAAAAAGLAVNPPAGIVEITIFSGSLYAVCFLPPIVFGLHWRKGSARAALGAVAVGVPVLLAWLLSGLSQRLHELFPALAASCVAYALLARSGRQELAAWPGRASFPR